MFLPESSMAVLAALAYRIELHLVVKDRQSLGAFVWGVVEVEWQKLRLFDPELQQVFVCT
jgi:hypothetical protein